MNKIEINIDIKDFSIGKKKLCTKYLKPKIQPEIPEYRLRYSKAVDLANDINIEKNTRHYAIVEGSFYFGDFIEALIVSKNMIVKQLTISTLSMNQNNIDSLYNILNANYVDNLDLIISHYFYSHEKWKLIPYLYDRLDKDNKFQLTVCRSHCKICLIELYDGRKIVMHGSANLRSSGNVEQIMIEENEYLYDFNYSYQRDIIETYKTIKKG